MHLSIQSYPPVEYDPSNHPITSARGVRSIYPSNHIHLWKSFPPCMHLTISFCGRGGGVMRSRVKKMKPHFYIAEVHQAINQSISTNSTQPEPLPPAFRIPIPPTHSTRKLGTIRIKNEVRHVGFFSGERRKREKQKKRTKRKKKCRERKDTRKKAAVSNNGKTHTIPYGTISYRTINTIRYDTIR